MIRELTKEDLNDLFFAIYYEGFLYHYNHRKDIFKKRTIDELKEYVFEQIENGIKIIGYYKDNVLVGFLSYEIREKMNKVLWIDELVVTEKERGNGYSSLLMEKIKKISKKEEVKRIELNVYTFNDIAIKLYNKLGYKEQRIIFEKEV
ncbi:MAG: GNAT family N-acetyltransferase [Bacilli bacterium]|nr:GNAT family N-acetyltransferase [Bacilli bacterium]